MDNKTKSISVLMQWANEIVDNGLVMVDDHIQGLRKFDHLVLLETGEGVFLCPIIDSLICCCLNMIDKDEDGYHLTHLNVGGNVWNKQFGKTYAIDALTTTQQNRISARSSESSAKQAGDRKEGSINIGLFFLLLVRA